MLEAELERLQLEYDRLKVASGHDSQSMTFDPHHELDLSHASE